MSNVTALVPIPPSLSAFNLPRWLTGSTEGCDIQRRVQADSPHYALADVGLMRSLPAAAWRLFRLAENKRSGTARHMWRVGVLGWRFAQTLGMPSAQAQALGLAAALHDVGKLWVPNAVLEKPGALTPQEQQRIREHPEAGARLLNRLGGAACGLAAEVALTHHERYDGRGYPYGLAGHAIPLGGRIVALLDVFDALASHRAYRPALTPAQVVATLLQGRGRHFDPCLVDHFLATELTHALALSSGAR